MKELKHFFGIFAALSIFFGMLFGMPEPAAAQDLERVTVRAHMDSGLSQSERVQVVDDYYTSWDNLDLDGIFVTVPATTDVKIEGPTGDVDAAVDEILGDSRFTDVQVIDRADISSRSFSRMEYHAETDTRDQATAPTDSDDLVHLYVDVEVDENLTNSEKLSFADQTFTDFKGAGLGGTFAIDPGIVMPIEMEGKSSDVEQQLQKLSEASEVTGIEILSEEYPSERLFDNLSEHTFNDPRHTD